MRPHRQQPTRLPRPWDSPGKNTGVGCHFLLQGRKVKSESEVAQSCPTLSDPMDCSLPDSSVHGIFQARVLEWGDIAFSLVGNKTAFKYVCRNWLFYQWVWKWKKVLVTQSCLTFGDPVECSSPGSSVHGILKRRTVEWVAISYSRGSSWPRDGAWVFCLAGRFFTLWATRDVELQIPWRKLP